MPDVMAHVQRIVDGLKMAESTSPYHLERADIRTLGEAMAWIRDWSDPNGEKVWRSSEFGDAGREALAIRWRWLRFCFAREIASRGGRP